MSIDILLAHATNLIHTPADVAKLRQLILTLAVQGKLVPQDAADEPAQVLLERIQHHKQYAKSAKNTQLLSLNFPLPQNWVHTSFGDIMINRDGERIPVSKEERDSRAKIYDYYGASGIIDKIDNYLFDKPLLLIGEDGANLINRSTPIAFIARGKYWVNNHAHVLDAIEEDMLRYIEIYINSINLEPYITGTAQPKMNQAKMNTIPIPLPPLAEQRRIVAKVDALMARCDELEALLTERARQQEQVAQAAVARVLAAPSVAALEMLFDPQIGVSPAALRQTILALAVQGKLVPQDAADEVFALPHQDNSSPNPDLFVFQDVIPTSWKLSKVGDIAHIIRGVSYPKSDCSDTIRPNYTPILRANNIGAQVNIDNLVYVDNRHISSEQYILEYDIIVAMSSGSKNLVGKAALISYKINASIGAFCALIRSKTDAIPQYLGYYFQSPQYRLTVASAGRGIGINNISKSDLINIPIPLPPLAEQRRIVTKVDALMALVDRLEAQQAQAQRTASALLDAVVAGEG